MLVSKNKLVQTNKSLPNTHTDTGCGWARCRALRYFGESHPLPTWGCPHCWSYSCCAVQMGPHLFSSHNQLKTESCWSSQAHTRGKNPILPSLHTQKLHRCTNTRSGLLLLLVFMACFWLQWGIETCRKRLDHCVRTTLPASAAPAFHHVTIGGFLYKKVFVEVWNLFYSF